MFLQRVFLISFPIPILITCISPRERTYQVPKIINVMSFRNPNLSRLHNPPKIRIIQRQNGVVVVTAVFHPAPFTLLLHVLSMNCHRGIVRGASLCRDPVLFCLHELDERPCSGLLPQVLSCRAKTGGQPVKRLAGAVVVRAAVGVEGGCEAQGAAEEGSEGWRAGCDYADVELDACGGVSAGL